MATFGDIVIDATVAAAEMEADRVAARNRRDDGDDARQTWWQDPTRIIYEPPGKVTREMAEGRLLRALSWCGLGQDLSHGGMPMSRFLAELCAMSLSEALAADGSLPVSRIRFEPLKQDRADFLEAMRWFCGLSAGGTDAWGLTREQQVLWELSGLHPGSKRYIARLLGGSDTSVTRI